MRDFANLYQALDRSRGLHERRDHLARYIAATPARDLAWAIFLLAGGKLADAVRASRRRPRETTPPADRSARLTPRPATSTRLATTDELRTWAAALTGLPPWLVEASHDQVGDLAETMALLVDSVAGAGTPAPAEGNPPPGDSLADWIETRLLPLAGLPEPERRAVVVSAWMSLPRPARLVFNKLLTGALRVGVSSGLVQQALAAQSGLPVDLIADRMQGFGRNLPDADDVGRWLDPSLPEVQPAQPYPFFLASPLTDEPSTLGPISDWLLEWKWDGIRAQLIRRGDTIVLWSRGEERLDGRFQELERAAADLPGDAVLDGEILAWRPGAPSPLPFTVLQTRINRLKPGPKTLADAPARLMVYDLLECDGVDWRTRPLAERRARLVTLLGESTTSDRSPFILSPAIAVQDWTEAASRRDAARDLGTEGLMLKRLAAPYQSGRRRGHWWKWKVDPLHIDAVLVYAQSGSGRRSTLFTDYTFALWDGATLVPVAKAYSGLDDQEILSLDRWIRAHTRERFGPVRAVDPVHVFELGFEGVNLSKRHKSGVAVRFPRILRWRTDKPAAEANRLEDLRALARLPQDSEPASDPT